MKTTKKLLALIFAVVLSFSILPTTNINAASKVKLSKTKTTIYVGKTVTLKLKNNKKKVKWTTSNKKIATVSKKGKVKGKKAGKVTITAKVGKKKYKCKITVKKKQTPKPTIKPTERPTTKPTETPTTKPVEQPTTKPTEIPTTEHTEEETTTSSENNDDNILNPQIGKNVVKLKEILGKQQAHETIDEDILNQIDATNKAEANNMWSKKFNINDAIQAIINDTTQYNKYINSHGGFYGSEYDDDYYDVFDYNDAIVKYLYDGTPFEPMNSNITCDEYSNIYKYFMFNNNRYYAKFSDLDHDYQYKQIFNNYMKLGHPQIDSVDMFILENGPGQHYYVFSTGDNGYEPIILDDQICSYVVTFSSNGKVYNAYMSFAEGCDEDENEFCEYRLLDLSDVSEMKNHWDYDKNEANALKEIITKQRKQGANISEDLSNLEEYSWFEGKLIGINWHDKNLMGDLDTSAFSSLKYLLCDNNQLSNLDVSKNTNLTYLNCDSNQLTNLDVSKNVNLTSLDFDNNQLTDLDVSKNVNLTDLKCNNNQLTDVDISKNVTLTSLDFGSNQLTDLDVSKNVNLTDLKCYSNQLTDLDVSKNVNLAYLDFGSNQLTNLDVSKNINLTDLKCYSNQLPNLDVSKNVNLTYLNCDSNQLTVLDVSKNVNLTYLSFDSNQLTDLNLSNNVNLTDLHCNSNQLTNLDVSNNINLNCLNCDNNQLTNLDVSNNINLTYLFCNANQLTDLDLSNNVNLTFLECCYNQLTDLDLSNNVNLTYLYCDNTVTVIGYYEKSQNEN